MKLDFAFICDYADIAGKINALGIGFDTIYASKAPNKHPEFFLVVQLRANVVEAGEKSIEVRLIDEDGQDIIPTLRAKFIIQRPVSGTESIGRLAMRLQNVEFPRYCSYSLHAVVEGHEMVNIPLKLAPPPQKK